MQSSERSADGARARLRGWLACALVLLMSACSVRGPDPAVMPTDDRRGWRLIFTDDFDRDRLGDYWGGYDGTPGGDPYSRWSTEHLELRDGRLILRGYQEDGQWITAGLSNYPVSQTYGRWEVRFRADASDEITYHFLLWPKDETWPPEIDFAEDFGGPRDTLTTFLHYTNQDGNQKIERPLPQDEAVDFTQWQTVGVEWTDEEIRYLLNGEVWATVTADEVGEGYPSGPMWLGLQAQSGGCQRAADWGFGNPCPRAGTPAEADVEIDWVAVYAPD